jgi:hypothetical protein
VNTPDLPRLDRRTAIKWMLTAAASTSLLGPAGRAQAAATQAAPVTAQGYGTDPDLRKIYKPGDVWPLTMTDAQRRTAAALCGAIIPADDKSPSADSLNVHDFIDEWISAPYPEQVRDRPVIIEGLAWVDAEAQRRFGAAFAALTEAQKAAICDDLASPARARPEFAQAARFFARFRDLTAGGFYTTPEGMKDLGYVGNVPTVTFDGPSPAALKHLGLA